MDVCIDPSHTYGCSTFVPLVLLPPSPPPPPVLSHCDSNSPTHRKRRDCGSYSTSSNTRSQHDNTRSQHGNTSTVTTRQHKRGHTHPSLPFSRISSEHSKPLPHFRRSRQATFFITQHALILFTTNSACPSSDRTWAAPCRYTDQTSCRRSPHSKAPRGASRLPWAPERASSSALQPWAPERA